MVLEGLGKRGKQSFAKKVEQDLASMTSYQIKKEMRIKNQEIEIKNSFLQGNRVFCLWQH